MKWCKYLHSGWADDGCAAAGVNGGGCETTGDCVMAARAARFCTDTGASNPPSWSAAPPPTPLTPPPPKPAKVNVLSIFLRLFYFELSVLLMYF